MPNAVVNSIHSHNVYNATNLSFTTTAGAQIVDSSEVSNWLSKFSSTNQYAIQNETYEQVSPGTCTWILEQSEFKKWMSQDSDIFWGVGIPGAGKTFLTSLVVHHLKERVAKAQNPEAVVFFYCRFNNSPTMIEILSSLLRQLVDNSRLVENLVKDGLYATCTKESTDPTQSALASALQAGLALIPRVFLVVDALDELRESIRQELVDLLVSFKSSIFFTSRELVLEALPTPTIRIRAPDRDFRKFIERELERLPKIKPLLRRRQEVLLEVVEEILHKSDGMFLLSALQVATLGGITTIKSLRKAVQDLPRTLTHTYELTVERIKAQSEEESSLAMRTILWATYSIRPLKPAELLAVLAIELDSTELDPDDLTDESTPLSVCCGLVTIGRETGLRLIHYTTHDFFLSYSDPPFDDPHTFSASICAVYRAITRIDSRKRISRYLLQDITKESYPFLEYAVVNLGQHTHQSTLLHNGLIPSHVLRFLSEHPSIHIVWDKFYLDRCNVAHFAALHGLLRWFEENPDSSLIHQVSSDQATPSLYAVVGGQGAVVDWLLRTGKLDINASYTFNDTLDTALNHAIRRGRIAVVEVFLQFGPCVYKRGASPLEIASSQGCTEIAHLILHHPGFQNSFDAFEGALFKATCHRHLETIKMLLAFPGPKSDPIYRKCLLHAIRSRGMGEIAGLFLTLPGIDRTFPDGYGSILLYAAENGLKEVIEAVLITPGFDVNEKDRSGRTMLHYAIEGRHTKTLSLLIRSGKMDINEKDVCGWTPLHIAADGGRMEGVRALLDCGLELDLNAVTTHDQRDPWGEYRRWTALQLAKRHSHLDIVKLLEERGAC